VGAGSEPDEDGVPTRDGRPAVLWTTIACAAIAVSGHVALLLGWLFGDQKNNALPWQPVVGASIAGVAIVSFGGLYYAALRMRVALAGSFVLTFLLLMTFVLTVTEIGANVRLSKFTSDVMGDFRVIVQTVIGFYFSTEALLSVTKIIKSDGGSRSRRADRDLPAG
jgi:hypothetical protein